MEIVLATNNAHKVQEFQALLPNFKIYSLKDLGINIDIIENGKSYQENSLIKAQAIAKLTDKLVIADDSGINVKALPNMLGIYSHRFCGEATPYYNKCEALLEMLKDKDRSASFETCITLLNYKKEPLYFIGTCNGKIANSISLNPGFGYDIVFIPDGYDKCFADLDNSIKNTISHRARAASKLVEFFKKEGLL